MNCGHCDVCRDRTLAVWRERALTAEADADRLAEAVFLGSGPRLITILDAHDAAVAQRGET